MLQRKWLNNMTKSKWRQWSVYFQSTLLIQALNKTTELTRNRYKNEPNSAQRQNASTHELLFARQNQLEPLEDNAKCEKWCAKNVRRWRLLRHQYLLARYAQTIIALNGLSNTKITSPDAHSSWKKKQRQKTEFLTLPYERKSSHYITIAIWIEYWCQWNQHG